MIQIHSTDSKIWNMDHVVREIIAAAIANDDVIQLTFLGEGPCLDSCKFYDRLDLICQTFDIDKNRFVIHTANVEEQHPFYQINISDNIWVSTTQEKFCLVADKKFSRHVACFIGKLNWTRLDLLSWLDDNYADRTLLTCHYDKTNLVHASALDLDLLQQECPESLVTASKFLQTCPRTIDDYTLPYFSNKQQVDLELVSRVAFDNTYLYQIFFAELVCETYFSGLCFFPTEKTFRPIMMKTPFVIFGPQGFLSNLRRCGFKTFDDYWDESYDQTTRADRLRSIKQVLAKLFSYDNATLEAMFADMQPILEHNRNRLRELQPRELKLEQQK